MKQVVILYEQNGNMNCAEVILYDEIHDAVPYIKKLLKNWDINNEQYQSQIEEAVTIEDIQVLIEENAIYTTQVHVVDKINPEV